METLLYAPAISGFFNVMFDRMLTRDFLNFLTCRRSTKQLLMQLRGKMIRIDKLLSDAEEKQTIDISVKSWLDEVKDALYAAEDLVDRIDTEALHHKTQADTLGSHIVAAIASHFLENVDSEIMDIYQRFENLVGEIPDLGLKEGQAREPSTSFVDESVICGRDSEKDEIIEFLGGNDTADDRRTDLSKGESSTSAPRTKNIRIVAITGLSGIGKTTLAQLVYNDSRLPDIFGFKSWVCVSEALGDVRQITKTILKSLPSCSSDPESGGHFHGSEDLNSLQGSLLGRLLESGKEFLIVLDDVLQMTATLWDGLIIPLKSIAAGGTILITTNNTLVAERMHPDYTLHLDKLSDKDCWLVVEKHAFQSRQDRKADIRKCGIAIASELALKCNGLPLAARMVGRLLGSTRPEKWEDVLDNDAWLQEDILPALLLSYNYLPTYLKRCFAYCSMFPESYIFERETLVQLWIAEGFVCVQNRSLPQVSGDYFDELVSRSYFQQSNSGKSQFIMHSLIHALARYVSGEFSCSLVDDCCPESTRQIHRVFPHRTRYLSYLQKEYDSISRFFVALSEVNSLRTFLPRTSFDSPSCFLSEDVLEYLANNFMGSIRVLSLSRYKITGRHLSNIGKLRHLRFLDLSYTSIYSLPESVCALYNLQTLSVSSCRNLTWLPDSIGDLKQLLYLNLSRTKISELPSSIVTLCSLHALLLSQCPISTLPAELGNLISLRHLELSGTKLQHMPVQIGKLSRLQTLTNFVVGKKGGANIEVLNKLIYLKGRLHISNLDVDDSVADSSGQILQDLGLDRLVLEWNSQTIQPFDAKSHILDRLLPNHQSIESIVIKCYNYPLPTRLLGSKFDKLVSLRLEKCVVRGSLGECSLFSFLKHLCLINLEIENPTNGGKFEIKYPKDHLETLRIKGLHINILRLSEYSYDDATHKLREVYLHDCPKLTRIDWSEEIESMKKLEIIKCERLCVEVPYKSPLKILILRECDALFLRLRQSVFYDYLRSLHIGSQSYDINRIIILYPFIEELIISDYAETLLLSLPMSPRSLSISDCRSLEFEGDMTYPCLQRLSIISTSYGPSTTFHLGRFINLAYLEIKGCIGLASISTSGVLNLPYLSVLSISDCPELLEFHSGHLPSPSLATLSVDRCQRLKSLPENMCTSLTSLQSLSIDDCPQIDSFPAGGFPPCLHTLCVKNCPELMSHRTKWPLLQVTCLRRLEIEGCDSTISFPEEGWLPASLTHLKITAFRNLKSLAGTELCRLTSLQALEISLCWNLEALPKKMPLSLHKLEIMGCPKLAECCRRNEGRDLLKISHLLGINIDGMDI